MFVEKQVKALKPAEKVYRAADSEGLYIEVKPNGAKLWRMAYRFGGKQKTLAIGVYPAVSILEAREAKKAARALLREGIDPMQAKKERKTTKETHVAQGPTFEEVGRKWFAHYRAKWVPAYQSRQLSRIEGDVYPFIGSVPIAAVTTRDVLAVVRRIEGRGAIETARRIKELIGKIFMFGIVEGVVDMDPSASLVHAMAPKPPVKKRKPVTKLMMPGFLRALDETTSGTIVECAIRWTLLTAVRTDETRFAAFSELEGLDGAEPTWRLSPERMKVKSERGDHLVPLSRQALSVLRKVEDEHARRGYTGRYLFPGPGRLGVISENAMIYALYDMGYKGKATIHGLRGSFSTELNENEFNSDWVELQLAHFEGGVRAAYNGALYLRQRREMMQWWADSLDRQRIEAS